MSKVLIANVFQEGRFIKVITLEGKDVSNQVDRPLRKKAVELGVQITYDPVSSNWCLANTLTNQAVAEPVELVKPDAEHELVKSFIHSSSNLKPSQLMMSDLTIDELFDTYCTQVKGVEVGNIVKRLENDGLIGWRYYRITSIRGSKANLGAIFGKYIYHKGIPVSELIECEREWYAKWSRSETYQCM